MAYDERLFERMRDALARKQGWIEKDMYGGRMCLLNGRPFIGVVEGGVVALCEEVARRAFLALKHCAPFFDRGKEMPGWVKVSLEALKTAKQLSRWVEAAFQIAGSLPAQPEAKPAAPRKPAVKKAAAKAGGAKKPAAKKPAAKKPVQKKPARKAAPKSRGK